MAWGPVFVLRFPWEEELNHTLPHPLQSEHFKTTSQKVARKFWWKNVKMIVLICVIVFIIILFIVLFASGVIPS